MPPCPEQLARWCELANLCAQAVNEGELSTCIGTSYALAAFLQGKGLGAAPVRVTASMHAIIVATTPRRRGGMVTDGTVLGSDGGGAAPPQARTGAGGATPRSRPRASCCDPTDQPGGVGRRPSGAADVSPAGSAGPMGSAYVWLYTEGAGYQHPAEYQDPRAVARWPDGTAGSAHQRGLKT